jgi:hypothetical protein
MLKAHILKGIWFSVSFVYKCAGTVCGRHLAALFIHVGTIQTAMFPVYSLLSPLQAIVQASPLEIKELYA